MSNISISDISKFVPSVKIPRINRNEFKQLKVKDIAPITFHHFTGQKKPIPPSITIHVSFKFPEFTQLAD